jgi:arabinose-5-phosphate isomerase
MVERGVNDFTARIGSFMGRQPRTCTPDELVQDAAARMREAHIDQLAVVDDSGRAVGLLDVQDLLAARFL